MLSIERLSEIKSAFSTLPYDKRVNLLSALALEITISTRSAYPIHVHVGETADVAKLIGLNEVQHTITGQLTKLLANDGARYPDDVFFDILFEKAKSSLCAEDLFTAIEFAFRHGSHSPDVL
jgi:hypothetical protein